MPTPPPDIDIELWERSIDLVAARGPARLVLTHFGDVAEPLPHLERAKSRLHEQAGLALAALEEHGDGEEAMQAFVEDLKRRTRAATDPDSAAVYEQGASVEQLWMGLRRYWLKQQEAA
jgi:hypothetical protein